MNPRSALPGKWRLPGVFSICFFAAFATLAAPKPGPSAAADLRGGEHASDLPIAESAIAGRDLLLSPEEEKKADALAAFVEGLIAEENADGDKALEAFQKVLGLDPGYTELAIKVAYEQARRGEVDAGINTLKDAIKAQPKDALPCLYLSHLYSKYLRKPELALKYAQMAYDLDPRNFATHLTLFELHSSTNQKKKADQVLERAGNVENDDPKYWVQLAELHVRLFLKEDGPASEEDLKKINRILAKAITHGKEDPVVLAKVADFYVLSRQMKEAIPLYLSVLKLRKDAPAELSIANVQDKLARSLLASGQREEALSLLQQIIKENPLRYESYELLGELYEEKGDYENALASYQQSLLIDGTHPINYLRVADMLLKNKQAEKAVEILREARKKFSDLPQLTYSLAVALSQAKKYNEAVPLFEEALNEAETRQQEMLNAAFYFSYGATCERAGLYEKATELLRKSIELDPSNAAEAYNYLGYMWVDKGENLEEAGDFIKRAVEMEPDNPAFIDSLGWFFYKRGNYQEAVDKLLKAAELMKPEDAVVFDHIADAYAKLNNTAKALIYWQKAATLDPENKTINDKIENAKQKVTANPAEPAPAH